MSFFAISRGQRWMTRRRDLLLAGGAIGVVYGASWWLRRPRFEFHELSAPKGFRRLALGATSGTNVFAGLEEADPDVTHRARDLQNPCSELFGPKNKPDDVPLAVFTDFNCQYCRILDPEILALSEKGGISVTWHDLPLLGPTSVAAARAVLAAGQQGAYLAFHKRMMRGRFVPTTGFLTSMANELGLNANQLIRDQHSQAVSDKITTSLALAKVFGIPGTPSLVVGRTLVVGNISPRQLEELIEIEAKNPGGPCFV